MRVQNLVLSLGLFTSIALGSSPPPRYTPDQKIIEDIWQALDTTGDLSNFSLQEIGMFFVDAKEKGQLVLYSPNQRGAVKHLGTQTEHVLSLRHLSERTHERHLRTEAKRAGQ